MLQFGEVKIDDRFCERLTSATIPKCGNEMVSRSEHLVKKINPGECGLPRLVASSASCQNNLVEVATDVGKSVE